MIQTENIIINGRHLTRTYSDSGYYIQRDGVRYTEAIDVADAPYTYTETETPIETPEMTNKEMLTELKAAYDNG